MKLTQLDYVQDILTCILEIEMFMHGLTQSQFMEDRKTILALTKLIEMIGEAAKNIPEETKGEYPGIPWRQMAGMRDRLTHKYYGIDLQILLDTALNRIPPIKAPILEMASSIEQEKQL